MTETSNRISVQSGFSEFSFEHNDDALLNSFSRSQDMLQSPSKSPLRLEGLVKENKELKEKVSEQAQIINHLKNEVYELQQALKQNEPTIKNPKALTLETNVTEPVSEVKIAEEVAELSPPPRSANRNKPSPIKTAPDSTDDTTIIESKSENASILSNKNNSVDHVLSKQEDSPKTPAEITRESSAYSAVQALSRSASPKRNLLGTNQSTPYKGRIQSSSSPLKSVSNASFTDVSDAVSGTPHTDSSPFTARSINEQETKKQPDLSQLASTNTSKVSLRERPKANVPSNISIASPYAVSRNSSMPSSPLDNRSIQPPDTPQTKSNLYDPYEGDFQHQQIHQYHNGYGGSYNAQGLTQAEALEKEVKHQRFPSDVPLFVNPHELSTIKTELISTVCGNLSKKSDDPTVVVAACDRQTGTEMWRFKKTLSQVILLDTQIRPLINSFSLPPVPEKSLFLSNIPVKVDIRRLRLRDYFSTLFTIPHLPPDAAYKISRFMSQDVVNLVDESNTDVLKDGYLLRRGKGLGNNWKARYCEIDGPFLNVFDARDGPLLEIIKLTGSQIGRQPDNVKPTDDKSSYRHAFAVMEPKKSLKSTTYTKHIFCAETDHERDLWVNVLVQFVEDSSATSTYSGESSSISSQTVINQEASLPSPTSTLHSPSHSFNAKGDDYDELEELVKESKRNKKRSFFPFSKKAFNEEMEAFKLQQQQQQAQGQLKSSESSPGKSSPQKDQSRSNIEKSLQSMNLTSESISQKVFHSEISESIKLSSNEIYGCKVPSIVYRCINHLISTGAVFQEGLFRLNGSASLIKQLREDFDTKYDIDFNEMNPRPDVNSIAGLLKLYLRELPTSILTKEFYPEFRDAYNQKSDPSQLSLSFREIMKKLPIENQSLSYVLFKFLSEVIENQDSNKMNLRNLCIVFSPTLNIASEVIIPFLVDFKCIFEGEEPIDNSQREVSDIHIPTF